MSGKLFACRGCRRPISVRATVCRWCGEDYVGPPKIQTLTFWLRIPTARAWRRLRELVRRAGHRRSRLLRASEAEELHRIRFRATDADARELLGLLEPVFDLPNVDASPGWAQIRVPRTRRPLR